MNLQEKKARSKHQIYSIIAPLYFVLFFVNKKYHFVNNLVAKPLNNFNEHILNFKVFNCVSVGHNFSPPVF